MLRDIADWITQNPQIVAGVATVLLAAFAAVQLALENHRSRIARESARIEARGWAWLARRNCEAALQKALGEESAWSWRDAAKDGHSLDDMQHNFLKALETGARAKGAHAKAVENAFRHFLAFADRVNDGRPFRVDASNIDTYGTARPDIEERQSANQAVHSALHSLIEAVKALEVLAPREIHEAAVPDATDLPLLAQPSPTALPVGHREGTDAA